MDENPETPQGKPDKREHLLTVLVLLLILVVLFPFVRACTSGGGYDDPWDRLERTVDSDPTYHQW